jgi:hypothetical protein
MTSARLNTVIERTAGGNYFIYDAGKGQQTFAPDSAEWFSWLAGHSSFHFTGKSGHFTARQEKKQRGDTYWYAYLKAHNRRHKRYLGSTEKLTLAKLEETACVLHEMALGAIGENEALNVHTRKPEPSVLQGLTVGPLTFLWHDDLLAVKTPTEHHYLNKTQAAELLGYLYDRRGSLQTKRK